MRPWRAYRKLKHLVGIGAVPIPTIARGLFRLYPDYRLGHGNSRSFMNLTFELTYRCNWACEFCFLKDNLLNTTGGELTEEEVLGVADQAVPLRLGVFITGGEPFMRKDTVSIIQGIKQRGLRVGVNTNHHPLTPDKIDALTECGLDYLITSIHGPKEVHEKLTGVQSYDRIMANLSYWRQKKHQTRLILNFVFTPENARFASEIVRIGHEAGVALICFQLNSYITPAEDQRHHQVWQETVGAALQTETSHLVRETGATDLDEMARYLNGARALGNQLGTPVFVKPDLRRHELDAWFNDDFRYRGKCSYLYTDIRVDPFGNVVACQPIPAKIGNVREQSLLSLANSQRMIAIRQGIIRAGGMFPACSRCCKLYRSF